MSVNDKIIRGTKQFIKKGIDYLVLFVLMYHPSILLARFYIKGCVFLFPSKLMENVN